MAFYLEVLVAEDFCPAAAGASQRLGFERRDLVICIVDRLQEDRQWQSISQGWNIFDCVVREELLPRESWRNSEGAWGGLD